ncbi:hypothetical protein N9M90_00930 [Alphaproteobacteria bacterium]|nr:hypothetical protein [Alphaproteobacteria bacterium]
MSRVSLQNGGGPGSSISLAPETIRVRNALIEKFTGEPLDEMNHFMTTALAAETNELRRIGILAARIYLLRTRIANLQDFNRDPSLTNISEINVGALDLGGATIDTADISDDDVTEIEEGWSRLKMTSPGEVQGVRFLSGAIIDAKPEDAEKLIRSGKAVRVDENGDILDSHENNFGNQDEAGSGTGSEDRTEDKNGTEDENGNSEARDSDNAENNENTFSAMTDEQTAEAENKEQPVMAAADDVPSDDTTTAEAEAPVSPDDESSDNADNKT